MATTNSINKYVQHVKSYFTDTINKIESDLEQIKAGTKILTADEMVHMRGTILRYRRDYINKSAIMSYDEIREIWENFMQTQAYIQFTLPILRNQSNKKVPKVPKPKKVKRKKEITAVDVARANKLAKIYGDLKQKCENPQTTAENEQITRFVPLCQAKSFYNLTEYYRLLKKQIEEVEKSK